MGSSRATITKENDIAKNKNTFAKMQRERNKKQKAEDKKKRKLERRQASAVESVPDLANAPDASDADVMESVSQDPVSPDAAV